MKLKNIFGIMLIALFALLLVACKDKNGGGGGGGGVDGGDDEDDIGTLGGIVDFSDRYSEKTTIKVWIDDENGEYMDTIITEFQRLNPDILVIHQHKGSVDSREHLKTFGPSGNGADVFQFPHDHLSSAILEDLVLALPNEVKDRVGARTHDVAMQIASLHYDETTKSFTPGPNSVERLYAIPMSLEAVGLYYNKDLVETPHTTYEALIAAGLEWNDIVGDDGKTNAERGDFYLGTTSHWADSYFIQHIYSAFGFTPFGPQLNDPSAVGFELLDGALAWMKDELKPVTTGNGGTGSIDGNERFIAGTMPYVIGGPWNIEGFKKENVNFGIAPLPSINGVETQPYAGAMMAAVYKYSKNQAAAIRFVEFLNSDFAMDAQFELKNKLPALKTELLSPTVQADEHLMAMSRQLANAVPMPTIPEVQFFWGPGESMVQEIWNTGRDIAEATEAAEAGYNALKGLGG